MRRFTKRYHVTTTQEVFEILTAIAERRNLNVADVIRNGIEYAIYFDEIENDPEATLWLRKGDKEKRVDNQKVLPHL